MNERLTHIEWLRRICQEDCCIVPNSVLQLIAELRKDAEELVVAQYAATSFETRAAAAEADLASARQQIDALREALTPSGETKAAYIGEFTIAVERHVDEDGEVVDETEGRADLYEHTTVPWTTIKEIMAAIRARAAFKGGSNG